MVCTTVDRNIKRVLITGAAGTAGRSFAAWLQKHHPEVEIHGMVRRRGVRIRPINVFLYEADLLDTGSLVRCLEVCRPHAIFHFAGNPDKGFEIPAAIIQNNVIGTVNLFEAIRLWKDIEEGCSLFPQVIVNASSSEIYGDVRPEEVPINEECPKRPVSPYGVSKLAQDHLGSVYYKAYALPIVTIRAFAYINNLRPDLFTSAFAKQIALIEAGKQKVLKHGNLDSVRSMIDMNSILDGYWLAATKGVPGEAYNLGGDEWVSVGKVLNKLLRISDERPESLRIPIEQDPSLLRPVDVTLQVPNTKKFRNDTGWSPRKFDLDKEMRELLDYWRKQVAKEL